MDLDLFPDRPPVVTAIHGARGLDFFDSATNQPIVTVPYETLQQVPEYRAWTQFRGVGENFNDDPDADRELRHSAYTAAFFLSGSRVPPQYREDFLLFQTGQTPTRYRSKELDPFLTDSSFFRSGKYRPTAYAPRDRDQAPRFAPRRELNRGPYTGAARCEGPRVFRKFGNNTRQRVMPFRRYTHMTSEHGFDNDIVGSKSLPSFIPATAALGQSGSEALLSAAGLQRTLGPGKPGDTHPILDG